MVNYSAIDSIDKLCEVSHYERFLRRSFQPESPANGQKD